MERGLIRKQIRVLHFVRMGLLGVGQLAANTGALTLMSARKRLTSVVVISPNVSTTVAITFVSVSITNRYWPTARSGVSSNDCLARIRNVWHFRTIRLLRGS